MVGTEMCHKALRHHSACGRTKSLHQRNPTRKARNTKGVAASTSVASLVVDREEKSAWFLFDHSGNNCCFVWFGFGKIFVYLLVFLWRDEGRGYDKDSLINRAQEFYTWSCTRTFTNHSTSPCSIFFICQMGLDLFYLSPLSVFKWLNWDHSNEIIHVKML